MAKQKNQPTQAKAYRNEAKKPMPKGLKYGLIFCACALVVAFILVVVLYNDGSLPVRSGRVVKEDNWIVANLSQGNNAKYYKLAEVNPPEGYSLNEEVSLSSDTNESAFWYTADDPAAQMDLLYYGGANGTAENVANSRRMSAEAAYGEGSSTEVKSLITNGRVAWYFTAMAPDAQEAEDEAEATTLSQRAFVALQAVRNSAIMIDLGFQVTDDMPALTAEEIEREIDLAVSYLTLEPLM